MIRTVAALAAACIFATGCATQQVPLNFHTASGMPELVIADQTPEAVRSRIIERAVTKGFTVDSETQSTVAISMEVPGVQESFLRLAIANSYSTPVRMRHSLTIVKVADGTKVMDSMTYYSTMPMGQVKTMPVTSAADLNAGMASLQRIADSFKI